MFADQIRKEIMLNIKYFRRMIIGYRKIKLSLDLIWLGEIVYLGSISGEWNVCSIFNTIRIGLPGQISILAPRFFPNKRSSVFFFFSPSLESTDARFHSPLDHPLGHPFTFTPRSIRPTPLCTAICGARVRDRKEESLYARVHYSVTFQSS